MHWLFGTILLLLAWLVIAIIRTQMQRPLSGLEGVVGTFGLARTDIAPEGQVEVRGMRWRAHALRLSIPKGSAVKVSGVSGLTLIVEQVEVRRSSTEEGRNVALWAPRRA
jgi:membrane-bound serine protease (ClpP class)